MKGQSEPKEQLLEELEQLRRQVAELKTGNGCRNHVEEQFSGRCDRLEELEDFVPERTGELSRPHKDLQREIGERKRAEDALSEIVERFDLAVRGANDGLWDWFLTTNESWVSPRFKELLGYSADDDFGNPVEFWKSILHPDDRDRVMRALRDHFERRVPFNTEYRMRVKSGEWRWFVSRGQALWDAEGRAVRMAGSIRDSMHRKRAEESLARQGRVLSGVNRVLQDALTCETDADVARTCLAVAEELTGSKFGMIGEVNPAGRYDTIALSNPGWDACQMPKSEAGRLIADMEIRGIWGQVLKDERSLIVNDPDSHPHRVGTPEGHPRLTSFLGVPLNHRGQTFGMIAVANKEGGYSPPDQQAIEALCVSFVEALMRKRAETALHDAHDILQQRVEERTAELATANTALKQRIADHKRAEAALRESQARFRALVESTSDWIWATDNNGVYTYCSPKVKDLLGYEPGDVVGKTPYDFMPPKEARRVAALMGQAFEEHRPLVRLENTNLHKDGRPVVLETSAVPVLDESGKLLGYRGIDRDITEFKHVEDSLREREQRYSRLLAAVTNYTYSVYIRDGVPVSDEHGEGCLAVTGYSPQDFADDPYLWISMVHPDDRDMVRQQVDRVLAREEVPPFEHRILRKDGAHRWVRDTIVRHCDENGRLVQYDGVVEDITERKLAEQALWQRELQLMAAQKIQERLLPEAPPTLPGFDVAGALYPAEFAAGDYFDYLKMPDGSLGLVIGDVAGHGFAPALIMSSTHVLLQLLVTMHTDVVEILKHANSVLYGETEEGRFVTLLLGRLDPRNRSFTYASAGHPICYLMNSSGEVKTHLTSTGLPLALEPDIEPTEPITVALEHGDMILLVTDGIEEAMAPAGEMFGIQRALDVVRSTRHSPAGDIVEALCRSVHDFCKPQRPHDDITAVVVKVR